MLALLKKCKFKYQVQIQERAEILNLNFEFAFEFKKNQSDLTSTKNPSSQKKITFFPQNVTPSILTSLLSNKQSQQSDANLKNETIINENRQHLNARIS